MQNAKDTFFEMLRDRVAAADASLTVVVRGTVRPAVVVEENELVSETPRLDCYVLRWAEASVDSQAPLPVVQQRCEIHFATAGSGAGMDRGRKLGSMEATLQGALARTPQSVGKKSFSALVTGGAVVEMGTKIWWSAPIALQKKDDGRAVAVDVWSYQEAGEA